MFNAAELVTGKNSKSCNGLLYSPSRTNSTKTPSHRIIHPSEKQDLHRLSNHQLSPSATSSRTIANGFKDKHPNTKSHNTESSMQSNKSDSFFDMLQDYQPAVLGVIGTNQRSPGPAEFMQDRETQKSTQPSNKETQLNANTNTNHKTSDPKVKNKIHRFLVPTTKPKTEDNALLNLSMLAKNVSIDEVSKQSHFSSLKKKTFLSTEEMEEQQRQRIFTHYDCQSMAASILYAKIIKNLSTVNHNGSSKSLDSMLPASKTPHLQDFNQGNELLENCPHYFNEISGENESRINLRRSNSIEQNGCVPRPPRRPMTPCSVSILESLPNETLWRGGVCPFQDDSCPIESVDHGAHYYKRYFCNEKYENWFGIDGNLGPTAISIKKEKKLDSGNGSGSDQRQSQSQTRYQFRIIIRTSELLTLRGLVIEDCIINSRASGKSVTTKELLEYVAPDIQLNCFRLGVNTPNCEQQLLKLDEQGLQSKYKVGILYCRSGQSSEEDMYNNEHAGPAFNEFLEIIGKRVRLKNFQQYKAGLDNKSDSTGTHSVYAFYKNCEIMFHVCTMLPFTPNNRQQLLRKRHIGNDIVTIIFQEPGALPFVPTNIRSQFQHVFLIVRVVNPCSSNTTYRVAITRSKEVPVFGPPLPASGLFSRNSIFTEFILAKIMNAENAAHRSEKFANLAIRTRREYLKDLCINYCTNTSIDPGNKFSIFANKKKEKMKTYFSGDVSQRGAICWRIMLQDHGLNIATECLLGISIETFVIIEESSKTVVFAMPTRSILGWSTCDIFFRIFYHNGECITMSMRYFGGVDEQLQVIDRLRAVTLGNGALELNIRRNMMGQLGFHVQPDGIVTQVDATGQAWAAGLRRGYRLVEVCKIVVATLSYTELIDLLKTSAQMNTIVIKSIADETPRLGCFDKNCKVNLLSHELDHAASNRMLSGKDNYGVKHLFRKESGQHPVLNYRRSGTYEQRSLPHKSKTCSGYNTGSSCFSTNSLDEHTKILQQSSISSLHSLKNNKWCPLDDPEQMLKTSYALNHDYPLKSFEHSSKYEDTSHLTKPSTPSSSLHDGFKVESWLQNDRSNFSPTPCANHKYDLIEFKHVNVSPTQSYILENSHPVSSENSKLNSGLGLKNKNTFHELDAFASPSKVKTAKVAQSVKSFNTPINSSKQSTSYQCRTKLFPSDLLEIMSPNSSSYYDSLKTKSFPVVRRDTSPRMLEDSILSSLSVKNTPTQSVKHEKLEGGSSSASVKRHQHIPSPIGTTTRINQIIGRDHHKNALSATLPVLQYSKELDWTTLVDTATKAIILQHKDENSCKKLNSQNLHLIVLPKTPVVRKEFLEATTGRESQTVEWGETTVLF